MMLGKRLYLITLLLVIGLFITACGTKDLTKGKTAKEILEASYQKMADINNFDMNIQMKMKMTSPGQEPVHINIKGTATIFQKPMRLKMVLSMNDPQSDKMLTVEQYLEETKEGMNIYQKMNDQWFKMVFKDDAFTKMINMDPTKSLAVYLENLERAEILNEEKIGEKETVKIEMVVSSKMYDEIMKSIPSGNMMPNQLPLAPGILSQIGDIKGIIWIDKLTLDIVKTSMDMTENIHNLGDALVKNGNFPKEAAEVFSSMEMSTEYEIVNQNKAQEFAIPEEALKAQELPIQ